MFDNQFYPTPANLAAKMAQMVDIKTITSVLEPSAGKGDLAAAVAVRMNQERRNYRRANGPIDFVGLDIDTIEIEPDLRHILKGHGIRVVHDDFLSFQSYKRYDLILMNPPFSEGARHLLKALDMQQNGGQIVCILNAETLKNPCTNERKELQQRLTSHRAKVEFIPDAFRDAERKTGVEIALIHVNIERKAPCSNIFENLRKAPENQAGKSAESDKYGALVDNDFIKAAVQQYNFEVQAGLKLIELYDAARPYMLSSFPDSEGINRSHPVITLEIGDKSAEPNGYIKSIRRKYWSELFSKREFIGLFTNNLQQEYHSKVAELADYDFSLYNIYTIKHDMMAHMIEAVENTIIQLFDDFSYGNSCEKDGNIHYYNGWKTNKAWKINSKIIQRLNGFDIGNYGGSHWCDYRPTHYAIERRLEDVEKVFNYLDGGLTEPVDLRRALKAAEAHGQTKKIECKYFLLTFYKKGSCHIEFKNLELLEKFNIFGSQRKGWLPPTYGKKAYKDMSAEEKAVVDEFQGAAAYSKTMQNLGYYLFDVANIPLLEAAQTSA